jgi:hypothetical protein
MCHVFKKQSSLLGNVCFLAVMHSQVLVNASKNGKEEDAVQMVFQI